MATFVSTGEGNGTTMKERPKPIKSHNQPCARLARAMGRVRTARQAKGERLRIPLDLTWDKHPRKKG